MAIEQKYIKSLIRIKQLLIMNYNYMMTLHQIYAPDKPKFLSEIQIKDEIKSTESEIALLEAKLVEITDADIEAWAEHNDKSIFIGALTIGAKAFRDGEIKHIKL